MFATSAIDSFVCYVVVLLLALLRLIEILLFLLCPLCGLDDICLHDTTGCMEHRGHTTPHTVTSTRLQPVMSNSYIRTFLLRFAASCFAACFASLASLMPSRFLCLAAFNFVSLASFCASSSTCDQQNGAGILLPCLSAKFTDFKCLWLSLQKVCATQQTEVQRATLTGAASSLSRRPGENNSFSLLCSAPCVFMCTPRSESASKTGYVKQMTEKQTCRQNRLCRTHDRKTNLQAKPVMPNT